MGRVFGWTRSYDRGIERQKAIIRGEEEPVVEYFGDDAPPKIGKPNLKDGGTRFAMHELSELGIDDQELSYHGDSIKTVAVERDIEAGEIRQVFGRFNRLGEFRGEYQATWEQTADGQLTHRETRRYR